MNAIELAHVSKAYGSHKVLSDISLQIAEGEMAAVTGPSGCGKTTLLNLIGCIDKYDSGEYFLFGKKAPSPGSHAAMNALRNTISFIFQNFALIEDQTVEQNLMAAMKYRKTAKEEKSAMIDQVLSVISLQDTREKKIYELSGGQQQRIALARAVIKPGRLLLADEPTGSLDPDNRDMIISLLKQTQKQGKTILIVTHDAHVSNAADSIIRL